MTSHARPSYKTSPKPASLLDCIYNSTRNLHTNSNNFNRPSFSAPETMANAHKHTYTTTTSSHPPAPYTDVTDADHPPPPYSPSAQGASTSTSHPQPLSPEKSNPYPPTTSPPPQSSFPQTATQPRTLHIYRDSLYKRNLTILDADKTPLYSVAANFGTLFSSKPHMSFYRGPAPTNTSSSSSTTTQQSPLIGTATFHQVPGWNIDITLSQSHSQPHAAVLELVNPFGRAHSYPSQLFRGVVRWEFDNPMTYDMTCLDPQGQVLARWDNNPMSIDKRGKLMVAPAFGGDGPALDEILVGCVAMIEWMRRRK